MRPTLKTSCGLIRGAENSTNEIHTYLGIRYANAGRWLYPQQIDQWQGIYEADHYSSCCIQERTYYPEKLSRRAFYYHEFREGIDYTYSEDCQYLNIWMPKNAENAPVLVYLHGGAFLGGSTQEHCFDGTALSKQGLVVVTVEFRLGIFGYGAFSEKIKQDGHTGNYGMYDVLTALQWIHDHISSFGGNPDNITLMGQSAGARMVQMLCISPLAEGLIHRGVMLSGGGLSGLFGPHKSVEEILPFWQKVQNQSGAKDFEAFKKLPSQTLIDSLGIYLEQDFFQAQISCCPVTDGILLPFSIEQAVTEKKWLDIPYIVGSTSNDIAADNLCAAAKGWAAGGKEPCYRYHFSRPLPGDQKGAFHSGDLWYWFGTLDKCWRPFTEWDKKLSHTMISYLCAFAKTGCPNAEGLPHWKPGDSSLKDEMMCFGTESVQMDIVTEKFL